MPISILRMGSGVCTHSGRAPLVKRHFVWSTSQIRGISSIALAQWVAGQDHEAIGIKLYEKDRAQKNQMLSEDQAAVQCSKMEPRLREWASAHRPSPGLISEPEGPDGWARSPAQMTGLAPYDAAGNRIGGDITPANAGPRYGEGPDTDRWAIELGTESTEGKSDDILTDEVVLGLLEDIDVPPNDKLVQLGYVRLKRNIASRDTDVGPTNSAAGAAAVVRHMARQATELGAAVAVQGEPDSEPDNAGTAPTEQLSTPMNTQT